MFRIIANATSLLLTPLKADDVRPAGVVGAKAFTKAGDAMDTKKATNENFII